MTPSRHAAHAGERTRVGALRGYAAILGVAVVLVIAYGAFTQPPLPADAAEDGGAIREQGAALFLQNCASCHGPAGQGAAAGPPLLTAGAAGADFYLRTGRMPLGAPGQVPQRQDPHFDPEEIEALVAYVASLGVGPADPAGDHGRRRPSRLGAVHGQLRCVPRRERQRQRGGWRVRGGEPPPGRAARHRGGDDRRAGRHAALRVRPARPGRDRRLRPVPAKQSVTGWRPARRVRSGQRRVRRGRHRAEPVRRPGALGRPSTARPRPGRRRGGAANERTRRRALRSRSCSVPRSCPGSGCCSCTSLAARPRSRASCSWSASAGSGPGSWCGRTG